MYTHHTHPWYRHTYHGTGIPTLVQAYPPWLYPPWLYPPLYTPVIPTVVHPGYTPPGIHLPIYPGYTPPGIHFSLPTSLGTPLPLTRSSRVARTAGTAPLLVREEAKRLWALRGRNPWVGGRLPAHKPKSVREGMSLRAELLRLPEDKC